jgi:hypothetical protein
LQRLTPFGTKQSADRSYAVTLRPAPEGVGVVDRVSPVNKVREDLGIYPNIAERNACLADLEPASRIATGPLDAATQMI